MPNVQVLSFWSEIIKQLLGETRVFGRTFIFCIFFCNGGALDLLWQVVELSVSLTMPRPAETTSKLNMSGLDFLVPVLQISNSFDLNAFHQVLYSLGLTVYKVNFQLLASGS